MKMSNTANKKLDSASFMRVANQLPAIAAIMPVELTMAAA
jgi:hypothetical protein